MNYVVYFLYFILFAVAGFYVFRNTDTKKQTTVLEVICVVLTLLIGFRDGWPDEEVYVIAFRNAPKLWDITFHEAPFGYVEKGYMFLASFVKTVYDNSRFYLLMMGGISMFLLYKSLQEYCVFPLIGVCDYVARFLLNRDFIQMRSSLAILMIILSIKFIYERKALAYFLVVLLAYQIHHMALLAIPLYFFNNVKLSSRSVVFWIVISMILSQTLANQISMYVEDWSEDLQYETYVQGGYVEKALGLANPMIYFQIFVLLLLSSRESRLRLITKYYDLFRMGYFYSTLILIFFCNYTALSGRTSTMFATLEMFIFPLLIKGMPKWSRPYFYIGIGFVLFFFFMSKYNEAMIKMSFT